MPRPTRGYGRPGTPVIPADWEQSHAPVARKTFTAAIKIYGPPTAGTAAVNTDLTYEPPAAATVLYEGPARIQVLNAQQSATEVGQQSQTTAGYLVAIDRETTGIPVGAAVQIVTSNDPDLAGAVRLYVAHGDRGSLRFERDLYCVDDLSAVPTS